VRALKAKRRFVRWARYQHHCWDLAEGGRGPVWGHATGHKMLRGYVMSSWAWSHARRYAPIGIREVRDPVTGMRY
jgi:hypothetical protein